MVSEEREGLRRIRRRRFWLRLLVLTTLPAIGTVALVCRRHSVLVLAVFLAAIVFCAGSSALSRCPRCGGYFHSKTGTPLSANIFARGCVRCGLPVNADRVIYPSME